MGVKRDLSNQIFGRWTALRPMGVTSKGYATWLVQCDCGIKKIIRGYYLTRGESTSCGCGRYQNGGQNPKGRPRKLSESQAMKNFVLSTYKCAARVRRLEWALSKEQFESLITENCHYCGYPPRERVKKSWKGNREIKTTCNGVDRKDSSLGYTELNVVSCCSECQYAKNDTPYAEFISYIIRAARHIQKEGLM